MKTMLEAIELVKDERQRQDEKWGYPQENAPFEWISILTEEVGKLARATNDALLGPYAKKDIGKAVYYAVHVSAVALAMVEHLSQEATDD